MHIEDPILQRIQATAGAPFAISVFETDPSGQPGSKVVTLQFNDLPALTSTPQYTEVITVIGAGENSSLIQLSAGQQALGFNTSHLASFILKRVDSAVELSVTDFSNDLGVSIVANLSGEADVPNSHHLKAVFLK